jgi:hypothetical protein
LPKTIACSISCRSLRCWISQRPVVGDGNNPLSAIRKDAPHRALQHRLPIVRNVARRPSSKRTSARVLTDCPAAAKTMPRASGILHPMSRCAAQQQAKPFSSCTCRQARHAADTDRWSEQCWLVDGGTRILRGSSVSYQVVDPWC